MTTTLGLAALFLLILGRLAIVQMIVRYGYQLEWSRWKLILRPGQPAPSPGPPPATLKIGVPSRKGPHRLGKGRVPRARRASAGRQRSMESRRRKCRRKQLG